MSDQQIPLEIRKLVSAFKERRSSIAGLSSELRAAAISKQRADMKKIMKFINTYKYSIEAGVFADQTAKHQEQWIDLKQTLIELKQSIGEIPQHMEGVLNQKRKNVEMRSRQALIQIGIEAQKESQEALQRIRTNLGGMFERADTIVSELDRQINKLDEVHAQLSHTQSTLRRAETHLKQFATQIYTDRLMVCMIVVIAIAIVVIVGLAIAGNTSKALKGTVQ